MPHCHMPLTKSLLFESSLKPVFIAYKCEYKLLRSQTINSGLLVRDAMVRERLGHQARFVSHGGHPEPEIRHGAIA